MVKTFAVKEEQGHMALFMSTYINKVDQKGRVSVPSSFRAALADQPYQGVVLFCSHGHACLEGFGWDAMRDLGERLEHFDMFSAEQDDMATVIFGESVPLPFDGDGRIILPSELMKFAGLDAQAAFVGLGPKFQIWAPDALAARKDAARKAVVEEGLTLPGKEAA